MTDQQSGFRVLSLSRPLTVAALTAAMLAAGLVGPAAGEPVEPTPETVVEELPGLPAAARGGRISEPVTAPMPFSMVGFEVPAGTEVEFRTSEDGTTWGPWTEAHVNRDEGPDAHSAEAAAAEPMMSEPVWVGEAGHLQTRLTGPAAQARPEHARVHLIDSSGLGRSWGQRVLDRMKAAWRGSAPAADAAPSKPGIVTRAQWGANESWRRGSPGYASGIVAGFVHHTAGTNSYTRSQSDDIVRGIYRYHTQSRGWSDIGYNFLVDRYGTIYEGRYGGITKAVIGAHAGGFNTATFGVSLMGTFDSARPTASMRDALVRLLAWKYDVHHTDVLGSTTYTSYGSTRYAAGQKVTIARLSGHRHVSTTSCPGGVVASDLSALRSATADLQNRQGGVLLYPKASPSRLTMVDGESVSGAARLSVRLRPAAPWVLQVRNSAGNVVWSRRSSDPQTTAARNWTPATGTPLGRYTYEFSSGTRRKARGTVTLVPPAVNVSATPTNVMLRSNNALSRAVTVSGSLFANAQWDLRITDPTGTEVHREGGTGSSMSSTWAGPGTVPGNHRWVLTVNGTTAARGTVTVWADRVGRRGRQSGVAAAAADVSALTFGAGSAGHAVLVRANMPTVALAAGPLAGRGGPVLYANATAVPRETVAELKRALRTSATLYVMGSRGVISDGAVNRAVAQLSTGRTVRVVRVSGRSAVAIAASAANIVLRRTTRKNAILVGIDSADGWRQGVAAGAAGARHGRPVLLTSRVRLAVATRRALSRNNVRHMLVIGNTSSVPGKVLRQRPAGVRVARVGGASPAAITANVSRRLFGRKTARPGDRFVFVNAARNDGWARAAAAAPYSARRRAPLLVTGKRRVDASTRSHLDRLGYSWTTMGSGVALGNGHHVSNVAKDALSRHLQ